MDICKEINDKMISHINPYTAMGDYKLTYSHPVISEKKKIMFVLWCLSICALKMERATRLILQFNGF